MSVKAERFAIHRLKGWPWRTCGGRLNREGKWEHCPFIIVPDYEHAYGVPESGLEDARLRIDELERAIWRMQYEPEATPENPPAWAVLRELAEEIQARPEARWGS